MSAVVLLTVAVLTGVGGWRLWILHRSLASMKAAVAAVPKRVDGELDRMWEDVQGLHAEHVETVEVRVRRAESAASQVARENGLVARQVSWIGPWVRHWASLSESDGEAGR